MGLDAVEIVMGVEEHFGITIKSEEAGAVRSVGDLINLVRSRIVAAAVLPCPSLRSYNLLRRTVREITGNPELRIRPSQRIESKLTSEERQRLWKRLPEMLGTPPNNLWLPPNLRNGLLFFTLSFWVGTVGYSIALDLFMMPIAILSSAFLTILLLLLSPRFRSTPPEGSVTFGDLTRQIVGTQMASKNLHLTTEDSILKELQPIIANTIGVHQDKVIPTALLIEDLGMD